MPPTKLKRNLYRDSLETEPECNYKIELIVSLSTFNERGLKRYWRKQFGGQLSQVNLEGKYAFFTWTGKKYKEMLQQAESRLLDRNLSSFGVEMVFEIKDNDDQCLYQHIPNVRFNRPRIEAVSVSKLQTLILKVKILLLTVTEWERTALLSEMIPLPGEEAILEGALSEITYRIGQFGNYCAAYTESTMGSGGRYGATLTAERAKQELKPKAIFLLGIAFGVNRKTQRLGDVLIAESIFPYELQKVDRSFNINRGVAIACGHTLSERFRMRRLGWEISNEKRTVQVQQGLVLSGEKVINNREFRDALMDKFPTAIGGEMEGAGAYATATPPTEIILIKSICDWADGDKNDNAQPFAAFTAVSFARHVLSKIDVLHPLIEAEEISPVTQDDSNDNYAKDILQLQKHSINTAILNSSLSKITIKGKEIKIYRDLTQELWETVQTKSLIVTGEPGSGKSGVLWDLFQIILREQYDAVFLSADKFLNISNPIDLRESIGEGVVHNLEDILKNWPGTKNGFLIIDALDKALSFATEKILLDIISIVLKSDFRWKVIVSIRKYDLEKNKQLQELFEHIAQPFVIPLLSDNEIEQARHQSSELSLLITQAEGKLSDLIKNIFNLRLLATLITSDVATSDLLLIQTQVQLLNKYWEARIIKDDGLDYIRENLLFEISEKMIEDKSLKCRVRDIINGQQDKQQTLTELLSCNILIPCDTQETTARARDFITFPHNILFDYAVVCKLQTEGKITTISETFVREPDLIFIINSSLHMYFRNIWEKGATRKVFWDVVFDVISSDASIIVKIVGPTIACQLIQKSSDYEILMNKLVSGNEAIFSIAEQVLRYMVAYLSTNPSIFLVGIREVRLAWCEFLERCSRVNRTSLTEVSCLFLSTICAHYQYFDSHQRDLLGIAARRFFQSAWERHQ